MPIRVSGRAPVAQRPAAKSESPDTLYANVTLSRKLDAGIVNVEKHKETQLPFKGSKGFVSPITKKPLQLVYLDSRGSKSGLTITYVDAGAKQFWAQGPGVSGLARGPFALPAGLGKELAEATKKAAAEDAKPQHGRGVRTDDAPRYEVSRGGSRDSGAPGRSVVSTGRGWGPASRDSGSSGSSSSGGGGGGSGGTGS